MEAKPREVLIYRNREGKRPFADFLANLKDRKAVAAIFARLNRVELGVFGDVNSIGQGLLELRIHHGPGYRVYFGEDGERLVLVLCAGRKNTQQKDIARAEKYWKAYQEDKS